MTLDTSRSFDVLVAGAGVVGAAIAWHAAQHGMRVAVVDAVGPAAAASGASDGAVSVASKRPGVLARLATASLVYTGTLAAAGGPLTGVYAPRPSFFFASDDTETEVLDALVDKLRDLEGPVRVVADTASPRRELPELGDSVRRLVHLAGEGHMLGYAATEAYLKPLRAHCFWGQPVTAFETGGGHVAVHLPGRVLHARQLVLALGVATSRLLPQCPVVPRAGQLIVTDAPAPDAVPLRGALTAASYLASKGIGAMGQALTPVVIDPLRSGQFLIGSSREPHGDPTRSDLPTLQALLRRAAACLPALAQRRVLRSFTGVRAAVADGLPWVGPVPGQPGVWVASGFEGDGICLSALVGREVGRMLAGQPGEHDWSALSPARVGLAQRAVAA